jgi:hypothetical protein
MPRRREERVNLDALFREGRQIDAVMRAAVRNAVRQQLQSGERVVGIRGGKIVWVSSSNGDRHRQTGH